MDHPWFVRMFTHACPSLVPHTEPKLCGTNIVHYRNEEVHLFKILGIYSGVANTPQHHHPSSQFTTTLLPRSPTVDGESGPGTDEAHGVLSAALVQARVGHRHVVDKQGPVRLHPGPMIRKDYSFEAITRDDQRRSYAGD